MAGAVELPGGRVLTPRAAAPQALHHFTRLDQVTQLVRTSEAEADVGFMARLLALCSLPRTNPGDRKEFIRRNGPYTLGMVAGVGNKLPYGTLPRLLLACVCTEAVRTGRRELVLGRSLAKFMRQIGITNDSGGRRGDRTRLRNQMDRSAVCCPGVPDLRRRTAEVAGQFTRPDGAGRAGGLALAPAGRGHATAPCRVVRTTPYPGPARACDGDIAPTSTPGAVTRRLVSRLVRAPITRAPVTSPRRVGDRPRHDRGHRPTRTLATCRGRGVCDARLGGVGQQPAAAQLDR